MFNLFRRRGRSTKQKKQQEHVAKADEFAANFNKSGEDPQSDPPTDTNAKFLKQSASASSQKVNLDSTHRRPKEKPQTNFVNYRDHADGVVVSKTGTNSRNEGADLLGRRNDNDKHDVHDSNQLSNEKPSKEPKTKSQSSNRRSVFFWHFRAPPTIREDRYHHLDEDEVGIKPSQSPPPISSSPVPQPVENNSKPSKRFHPIEKGRELLNDILMAKGRHRNHRNHHHHHQQKCGGSGGVQLSNKKSQQDLKKSPAEVFEEIPEPSSGQHTYQISRKSKNIQDRRTTDGAVTAALASIVSVVGTTTTVECADSSDKNNLTTTHSRQDQIEKKSGESQTISDVTISESSCDDQTIGESASKQVQRKNASDEVKIGVEAVTASVEGKDLDSERVTVSANVEELGHLNADNLSELTECDRDRFIINNNNNNNTDMGQSQAKSESTSSAPQSRSPSPKIREFRESHIDEQKQSNQPQLIVPTIVVEDFGNVGDNTSNTSEKGDIFYDVETSRPVAEDKIEDHLLKVPDEGDDDDDEEDDEEDQWHFVNNPQDNHHITEDVASTTNYPKAENSSDSNLSTSDSGILTSSEPSAKVLHLDSCDLVNDSGKESSPHRFRDGSSTDCDENLPQCDDFDYFRDLPTVLDAIEVVDEHDNHSGILIESISLPDVVVESTTAHGAGSVSSSDSVNSDHLANNNESDNIDNSTNIKMGNVHFIPIRVEKRKSVDDSVLMTKSANGGHTLYNGQQYNEQKPTLEITPEEDEDIEEDCAAKEETKKKDLVDQESQFSTQLDDAQKNIYNLQSKVNELQSKIDDLEKELSVKSWNVDRLQGELGAAHKEDQCVRSRLRLIEEEKSNLRQKYFETEEELNNKYDHLDHQYKELEEKYKNMRALADNLQTQLACAQSEADQCRLETEKLRQEKDEQVRILEESLTTAKQEQESMQAKWQKEFESLRTQNADREEHLLSDCEWQLRQMQKSCKDKLDKAEYLRKEAVEKTNKVEQEAEEKLNEVIHLRSYEAEVKQLRGLTIDQENSITNMREQIESLKDELVTANENLEEQIECVRKIKYQCDNSNAPKSLLRLLLTNNSPFVSAIYDKERQMLQRIDEVRNEAAARWENKLLTEMTRLKMELESVYVDERREELDKLQAEHIEELKALTSRYTANEEELRAEILELRQTLKERNEEFMSLREKSDNAILQTRMHLDRADRDYQNAMCREEERREKLAETLREEFEVEKLEMEEKFRERLGQVQDEFNKELQISTQEISDKHRKELEQQWQKLISEKEEAIQELETRHRKKLEEAENRLIETETRHQHGLADLKIMYDTEKASLDKRDLSNTQEIEQLHRKCRCLTNLFEEMRMRYERRDPRPEDLREIAELRSRCESQERDLYELTDRLREMQIQMEELQANGGNKNKSKIRKPPPKTIPTNCDVIYEENEERDSPPPLSSSRPIEEKTGLEDNADDEDEEDEEDDEDDDDEEEDEENSQSIKYQEHTINDDDRNHPTAIVGSEKTKSFKILNETIIDNNNQTINNFNQIIEAEEC